MHWAADRKRWTHATAACEERRRSIETAGKSAPKNTAAPDLPIAAVLGAIHRVLGSRLRRTERTLGDLQRDLLVVGRELRAAAGEHRWGKLKAHEHRRARPISQPPSYVHRVRSGPAAHGPRKRRSSKTTDSESCSRPLRWCRNAAIPQATILDIILRAGMDGRAFYRIFGDKQEAFSAIHELGFQYLMAVTARAFFGSNDWPERIWEAFRAATQSIDDIPAFAHVAFVEAYAVGPRGVQRVEDSHIAFTIFLQEGYRYQREGTAPPQLALEAIITTIFEVIYLRTRASATPKTAGLLAHLVHLCLVPFLGSEATNEFIDAQLAASAHGQRKTR